MEKLKITGKKVNKKAIEILRNIQLLCFIEQIILKNYINMLIIII